MGSKRPAEADSPTDDGKDDPSTSPPVACRQRVADEDKENREMESSKLQHAEEGVDEPDASSPLKRVNHEGRSPEAGIISRVDVENFMCHRKLTIELCSNVNFIHGQNGSGKSAILAAVQICLGAGARRTHRARNLKDLVRKEAGENCSGAKVRVTILNKGNDAYQHDKYGDFITVERTISLRGGYNGYKLLDEDGNEVSHQKKDLDAMLDQLNIQVENPVAVLDQEEAKKFLTGKSEDKYSFFMKATELERIDRSYAAVTDNLNDLISLKTKVQDSMQGAIENVQGLKKEWKQFQELEKLQDKVEDLKVNYAWAYYDELQKETDEKEEHLEKIKEKRAKRIEELTQIKSLTNGPDEEQERLKDRIDCLIQESNTASEDKKNLESELKRAVAPVKYKQRELDSVKKELRQAEANLKGAKSYLQEERERIRAISGSAPSVAAERTARMESGEKELEGLHETILAQTQTFHETRQKHDELDPRIESAVDQVKKRKSSVIVLQHKIRDLNASENASLAIFGPKCSAVHRRVEAAMRSGKWRGQVVGPIGAYMKVDGGKERFAALAELAIGSRNLDRFIVTNDQDRQLFMKIRQDTGCSRGECSVWQTATGARYHVPPPPAENIETVASCLNVEDDLVFNVLVDQRGIDQIALTESKQSGERSLLIRDAQGREAIRGNIKNVYLLPHGDNWKVVRGSRSMISRDSRHPLRQTIGADKTAALHSAQQELEDLENDLKESQRQHALVLDKQKEYKVSWNKMKSTIEKGRLRVEHLEKEISDLRVAYEESNNIDMDTTELEEEVANAAQIVQTMKGRVARVSEEMKELSPAIDETRKRLEEVTARNEKVLDDMKNAEESLEEHMRTMSQQQAQLEKKRSKVQQMDEIISKHESNVEECREESVQALRKARFLHFERLRDAEKKDFEKDDDSTQNSERQAPTDGELEEIDPVQPPKEASFYKTKAERAKKRLEEEKVRRSLNETDPAVAFEKYNRAKKNLQGKMAQVKQIEENENRLTGDLKDRKRRWKQFQQHISDMTSNTFDEILNTKGSSGELEFDHHSGSLDLIVQKDNTQESSQTKDVKALSGGERSFTTLALLLALGERLETPFRVMDEFDVFLDPVARKIAMTQLIATAQSMKHRQFIFITPQDVSSLTPSSTLKIHRMKPPAKSGLVGGPSQQILEFGTQGESQG